MRRGEDKSVFDKMTTRSAIVIGLCSLPLYSLVEWFWGPAKGRQAAIFAAVIMVAAWLSWDLRKKIWFWIAILILILMHIPLVLLVPWTNNDYPGVVLMPVALLDFAFVLAVITLLRKAFGAEFRQN